MGIGIILGVVNILLVESAWQTRESRLNEGPKEEKRGSCFAGDRQGLLLWWPTDRAGGREETVGLSHW